MTGTIRTRHDDFFVDEVVPPRTEQEGEHLHVRVEKRGVSTEEAVRRMTKSFGVHPRTVGRCGRKDVSAVTRQWLSFTGVKEAQVDEFADPAITVLEHVRLPRKLRMGRFLGNRFRIRVRELNPEDVERASERLPTIVERGLSNAFGQQRFGPENVNGRIGRLLVEDNVVEALRLHVENSYGKDVARMRRHMEADRFDDALKVLGRRRSGFYISAWQAEVFNQVLERRGDDYDKAIDGDVFEQHSSGRLLTLEDPVAAVQAVAAFEVSPTGPLPGPSMREVTGAAHALEADLLPDDDAGLPERRRWFGCMGSRRAFRVPVTETSLLECEDDLGAHVELKFRLPPGTFATTLLSALFDS